jgi:2-C-methyl-D-erythritol 4-phosphate cytidylyltransferase
LDSRTSAIIVAAGAGSRLSADLPKAFVSLAGMPMFAYSLRQFDDHAAIDELVLVAPASMQVRARSIIATLSLSKPVTVATGGEHRWQSVRNGLDACDTGADWVLVHDAARPFVSRAVVDALLAFRGRFRCAFTATPMVDTVRRVQGDTSVETLDRSALVRVGTPQLFHRQSLLEAFARTGDAAANITDEVMLMEQCGHAIGVAQGDPLNFKITTPHDLAMAEALCAAKIRN